MIEQPNDPTPSQPVAPDGSTGISSGDENGGVGPAERRRRRKLKVIVASAITGSLVTGGTSYAVLSSRGAAEHVADAAPATRSPSTPPSSDGGSGGGQVIPVPPGFGGTNPFGGSLAESTDTTAATQDQQVGVVDIYTALSDGSQAAGTGMILTSNGEVLTNNHVIEGSTDIKVVVVSTDRTYDATVVGTDAGDDIAVLQLDDAQGLDTVTTDTSGDVQVGDDVTGVGNAGGDGGDPSAANGTVVALDRAITVRSENSAETEKLEGLIEVDADIISGDSGGPLYDADNEVVGVNTAASSGRADVTGFAIPIATALRIADDIEAGRTTGGIQLGYPAFLGIGLTPVTHGAYVAGVQPGSGAAAAGIAAGDRITSFGRTTVRTAEQLVRLVGAHAPGDRVKVSWTDSAGGKHTTTVTLGPGPAV